jgi:hypothetical protein
MTPVSAQSPLNKPVLELNIAAIVSIVGIPPQGQYYAFPYHNIPMRLENDNGSLRLVVADHSYPIITYTMPTRNRKLRAPRGHLLHDETRHNVRRLYILEHDGKTYLGSRYELGLNYKSDNWKPRQRLANRRAKLLKGCIPDHPVLLDPKASLWPILLLRPFNQYPKVRKYHKVSFLRRVLKAQWPDYPTGTERQEREGDITLKIDEFLARRDAKLRRRKGRRSPNYRHFKRENERRIGRLVDATAEPIMGYRTMALTNNYPPYWNNYRTRSRPKRARMTAIADPTRPPISCLLLEPMPQPKPQPLPTSADP